MVLVGSAMGATSSSELGRCGSRSRMNRWSSRCATSYSTSVRRGRTTFQPEPGLAASRMRTSEVMAEPATGAAKSQDGRLEHCGALWCQGHRKLQGFPLQSLPAAILRQSPGMHSHGCLALGSQLTMAGLASKSFPTTHISSRRHPSGACCEGEREEGCGGQHRRRRRCTLGCGTPRGQRRRSRLSHERPVHRLLDLSPAYA